MTSLYADKDALVASEIGELLREIEQEEISSNRTLHMTANENIMSKTAERLMASNLSYRYYSDTYDPENKIFGQKFYVMGSAMYRGLPAVYALEDLARDHSNRMFHAKFSDFIPLSGMHAVTCIISTLTKPGDKVFIFTPDSIGHHATGTLFKNLGRNPIAIPWDFEEISIDLEAFERVFQKERPTAVFLDLGRTFYPVPLKEIRQIVGNDIKIIYDASHVLGLIAGGKFQSPLEEGCDVLIGNTHKTFPGPQKAMMLYADEDLGRKTAVTLFSSAVSSQHTHHSLALYVTIFEMSVHGQAYAEQIVKNAHALSQAFLTQGFKLITKRGELPHAHMIAISGDFPKGTHHACKQLHKAHISTNTQKVFGVDCLRLGVQELTRRGMKELEMEEIAEFFRRVLIDEQFDVGAEVLEFNHRYNQIFYTLDEQLLSITNRE